MPKRLREWLGTVADVVALVSVGVAAVVAAIVGAYLTLSKAGLDWSILAAVGTLLIVAAGIKYLLSWLNSRFDPVGEESYLREKRIRVADLVTASDPVVKGRTFDRCRLFGPAVIAMTGAGIVDGGIFDGDLDSTFISVPDGTRVIGVVVLDGCVLRNCRFHQVGIMGPAEQVAIWKKGFAGVKP